MARNSLERFVKDTNQFHHYRFEKKWLWKFLWECHFRWCPAEVLAIPLPPERDINAGIADSDEDDFDVSGTWLVIPQQHHPREIILDIQQKGKLLGGQSTHTKKEDIPSDNVRIYTLTGRIYNRIVQLNGVSQNRKRVAINSFLLELVTTGETMNGVVAAYNTEGSGILSLNCECRRVE